MGFFMIGISLHPTTYYTFIVIALLTAGLLSDIFDGIIARRLQVSSQKLRRLDSSVDQIFFLCTAVSCYIHCGDFFKENAWQLLILIGAEAGIYLICFLKFKKEVATHSIGAKVWTLLLFSTLVEIFLHCQSGVIFQICFWLGIITRMEIAAILLILKEWTNDVPTFVHAIKIRNGLTINRHRLFNG
jgi:CDP-diacylglycerol--glycerol-3-phosphate 3-phosphatidyltransferase